MQVDPDSTDKKGKKNKAKLSESAGAVAQNLMLLVNGATVGELASLEELVTTLVKTGDLGKEVFQVVKSITTCLVFVMWPS